MIQLNISLLLVSRTKISILLIYESTKKIHLSLADLLTQKIQFLGDKMVNFKGSISCTR